MKFGNCEVAVPKKGCCEILVREVLNPFYIFQIFSVALWMSHNYYYFAGAILVISTASIILSLCDTMKNNKTIREMARYSCQINLMMPNNS